MRRESDTSFVFGPDQLVWSRMGNTLGWIAIPWMAVVLVVAAAIAQSLPRLLGDPYSPARMAIPLIGFFPLALTIAAAVIGPRGPFRPFFVDPQPRATIDESGIIVRRSGVREETSLRWEQIGGLALDGSHNATLVDVSGVPLIEVPRSLLFSREKRTRKEMCLSAAVVQARPDRYTRSTNMDGCRALSSFDSVPPTIPHTRVDLQDLGARLHSSC
jgi:hypothetical protein